MQSILDVDATTFVEAAVEPCELHRDDARCRDQMRRQNYLEDIILLHCEQGTDSSTLLRTSHHLDLQKQHLFPSDEDELAWWYRTTFLLYKTAIYYYSDCK